MPEQRLPVSAGEQSMARAAWARLALALLLVFLSLAALAAVEAYQYRYDDAGRLVEVRTTTRIISYQYDDAGTITTRSSGINDVIFDNGFE